MNVKSLEDIWIDHHRKRYKMVGQGKIPDLLSPILILTFIYDSGLKAPGRDTMMVLGYMEINVL